MAPVPLKSEKAKLSMGVMVMSGWKSKDYSALAEESVSLVGKFTGNARDHLRGLCTPDCWGWPNEVGSPTTILKQKATRGTGLASPNGAIYVVDALRPY